jgi:hypothetical protein
MQDVEAAMTLIHRAFDPAVYPGDAWLIGSRDGCEPEDEVGPFRGNIDWRRLGPDFLDAHAGALHFFSEAGLRFFLPAFLLADLRRQLNVADPCFTLTHGFLDPVAQPGPNDRAVPPAAGRSALINPRRFGALTFEDYARYRLSVFTREEAVAIVAYLECQRDVDPLRATGIDAALNLFWRERARSAPHASAIADHLERQQAFLRSIQTPPSP